MEQEKIDKLDELRNRLNAMDKHIEQLDKISPTDPDLHLKVAYGKDSAGRYNFMPLFAEGLAIRANLMVQCYTQTMKALRAEVQLEIDNL